MIDDPIMSVYASELQSMLQNENTVIDALISVATSAQAGDLIRTLEEVSRSQQLILQAIKSNHALIHQIRIRTFEEDKEEHDN